MVKTERVNLLVEKAQKEGIELKKSQAEVLLSIVDDMQVNELLEKGVATTPFGNMKVVYRQEREGRNPKTKEIIQIPAKLGIKLSATKSVKEALDNLDKEVFKK